MKLLKLIKDRFITKGIYKIDNDDIITVTELPVGTWTDDFKLYLENEIQKEKWILDYENHSTDENVNFKIKVNDETLFDNTYKNKDVIEEKLKLISKNH